MSDRTMLDRVRDLVALEAQLPVTKILRDDKLEDLGLDALDALNLQDAIFDTIGVTVPTEAMDSGATVGSLAAAVQRLVLAR